MNSAGSDFGEKINSSKTNNDQEFQELMEEVQEKDQAFGSSIEGQEKGGEETQFYLSEEEFADQRTLNRLKEANELVSRTEQVEEVSQILQKLEVELEKNKFGDLEAEMRKERENALSMHMTSEDKEFLEMVDQEYYKRVKTSSEYYRRKKLILQNLEKLQKKVESSAKNYDDYAKLKFIMIEKAKQKRSVLKNFVKLENYQKTNSTDNRYYD